MSNQRNIIVIGGGAAGMIAAIAAAKEGCAVSLYEKNEKLGKKIFITGKGRCNVTNAGDMDELFAAVITNKKFMFSSFYGFTNEDMMQFLEDAGLRLKTERGKRVFPLSDHSSDVIAALERTLKKENVKVYLRKEVKGLNFITEEDKTICKGIFLEENGKKTAVDAVVSQYTGLVACGTQDPETLLPEFNQALEAAGINDIIEENQRQLDEWLAAQK